jgi:hypothetical protein
VRLFGYPNNIELDTPLSMKEVSFVASPHELRLIASFLQESAESIEKHGADFSHEHFVDYLERINQESELGCDVIVASPD